jgi:hypothetical protein
MEIEDVFASTEGIVTSDSDFIEAGALKQLSKIQPVLTSYKEKVKLTREETLKEVGEWLETYVMGAILKDGYQFKDVLILLKSGNLPEKG